MDKFEFGKFLIKLRGKRTIGKISLLSGVSISYLSQLEQGKRNIPTARILLKLAKAYRYPYEDLLFAAGLSNKDDSTIMQDLKSFQELQKYDVIIDKVITALDEGTITTVDIETFIKLANNIATKFQKNM